MKTSLLIGLLLTGATTTLAQANPAPGSLTVNVTGFGNTRGQCALWLFTTADGFPSDNKKAFRCAETPITGPTSQYVFTNLPAGSYALGVFHDENGNHKLDANVFHIPKEAYGISNDVRGGMGGPPTFDQAKITVSQTGLAITIKVR